MRLLLVQSKLDIADFLVTSKLSAISSFSAIQIVHYLKKVIYFPKRPENHSFFQKNCPLIMNKRSKQTPSSTKRITSVVKRRQAAHKKHFSGKRPFCPKKARKSLIFTLKSHFFRKICPLYREWHFGIFRYI